MQVTIAVPVPAGVKGRDIQVDFKQDQIKFGLRNADPIVNVGGMRIEFSPQGTEFVFIDRFSPARLLCINESKWMIVRGHWMMMLMDRVAF